MQKQTNKKGENKNKNEKKNIEKTERRKNNDKKWEIKNAENHYLKNNTTPIVFFFYYFLFWITFRTFFSLFSFDIRAAEHMRPQYQTFRPKFTGWAEPRTYRLFASDAIVCSVIFAVCALLSRHIHHNKCQIQLFSTGKTENMPRNQQSRAKRINWECGKRGEDSYVLPQNWEKRKKSTTVQICDRNNATILSFFLRQNINWIVGAGFIDVSLSNTVPIFLCLERREMNQTLFCFPKQTHWKGDHIL